MSSTLKPYKLITDYITGKEVPNIGAEENRQALERFLVEEKGYFKEDIEVDVDIEIGDFDVPSRGVWTGTVRKGKLHLDHTFHTQKGRSNFGDTHHDFVRGDFYHNVVSSFQLGWVAGFYIIANLNQG